LGSFKLGSKGAVNGDQFFIEEGAPQIQAP
jgi:hypothetical protein